MGYEVDFFAVGEGSKSGDAIALRFGNLYGSRYDQTVVVIDGGYTESGEKLVSHIQGCYQTRYVDLVVSTHPDADHACGLAVVLEELDVGCLWIHQPWNHTKDIANLFQDGRVTDNSVRKSLKESLEAALTLENLAKVKGIPIIEPFCGLQDKSGCLTVLGPTQPFYESLLPHFRGTPEPKLAFLGDFAGTPKLELAFLSDFNFAETVKDALSFVFERWDYETLDDNGKTSAENESSAILLLSIDGHHLLFTGDAGRIALTKVTDLLEYSSFDFSSLKFIQVPHHGSQRNIGPSILNRLLGGIQRQDIHLRTAFVSAAKKGSPKHPAKKVTNAFKRRGTHVYVTEGKDILHSHNAPVRQGWTAINPLPFYTQVEE